MLSYQYVWRWNIRVHFASTPTWILNLTIPYESQPNTEFNDTFCVGKYCQLFTHESIINQYVTSRSLPPLSGCFLVVPHTTIAYTTVHLQYGTGACGLSDASGNTAVVAFWRQQPINQTPLTPSRRAVDLATKRLNNSTLCLCMTFTADK